jgi:hypothetical protein
LISDLLFGSQAHGDARHDADIDLFIVINQDSLSLKQELAEIAWQIQFSHNVIISDIIRSVDQFQQMTNERFPYFINLENEGILLWKNASEPIPKKSGIIPGFLFSWLPHKNNSLCTRYDWLIPIIFK